ncbi:MAG TPA: hypothetical protein VF655_02470 [Allosphingosinicella sp.]
MSFDTWFFGLSTLLFASLSARVLVVGRCTVSRPIERRAEPGAYWLATGFILVLAALSAWSWWRSLHADPDVRLQPATLFGPYCLYVFLEALRAGELRLGNNHFPRRGRALAYWTILLLILVTAASLIAAAVFL